MVQPRPSDDRRSADAVASRAVRRFARRVRAGRFLSGVADGALAGAVAFAAVALVARVLGRPFPPLPWAALAAAPALALGAWRALRARPAHDAAAGHLDRRLAMSGLLLAARERGAGAWEHRLRAGLADAAAALPRPRWGRLLARAGPAVAIVAAVALLPPPEPPRVPLRNPLLAEALDRFDERLEVLKENRLVEPKQAEDLERRAEEVEARAERGERVEWADVDALGERLEGARATSVASLARAAEAAGALAGRDETGAADEKANAEALEEARAAFAKAEAAGLGETIPKEWAERLSRGEGASGEGAEGGFDAEDLARLAEAMGEAAGDRIDGLEAAGALSEGEALDLRELVEAAKGKCPDCPEGAT